MRIAHFSDPHLCGLRSNWSQLRNDKQLLGALNWITRRGKQHRQARVEEAIQHVIGNKPDLLIVTGDISQLALECDYQNFANLLKPIKELKIPVIIMRGNHDLYSHKPQVIESFANLRNNFTGGLQPSHEGVYEFPEATIAEIDAAVRTNIKSCNGEINKVTVNAVGNAISSTNPKIPRLCLCHFPILQSDGKPQPEHKSLHGREALLQMLHQHRFQLYLCGHIHQPFSIDLENGLTQYCAGSASAGGCLHYFTTSVSSISLESSIQL